MNEPIEPLWKKIYKSHPRSRPYALTPESEREIETLWHSSGQNKETFFDALETLVVYGVNAVRPVAKAKWTPPPERKGSSGQPLPNPWAKGTRNKIEQRAIMMVDPPLGEHLRKMAESPWTYQLELDEREAARLRWNEANENYDDAANPLKHGDAVARSRFIKETDEAPEKREIFERECAPVSIRLFGPIRSQNRTAIHQIAQDGNAKLLKIILDGQEFASGATSRTGRRRLGKLRRPSLRRVALRPSHLHAVPDPRKLGSF